MHMRRIGRSALALTLALLFSMFIACSGSNQNTGNPTHAAELPTAMTSEAPTPEPTPEPYIRLSVDNSEQDRGVAVLVNYCHPYTHTDEIITVPIPENDYIISSRADIGLPSATFDELLALGKAFYEHTGTRLCATSGYRTEEYQLNLYNEYEAEHGAELAQIYVASPGASEHHTGLAADLSTVDGEGNRLPLEYHSARDWFNTACSDHGFILRYPVGREMLTRVAYEPWHFRYVGVPIAHSVTAMDITYEEFIDHIKQYSVESGMLFVKNESLEGYLNQEQKLICPEGYLDVAEYDKGSGTLSIDADGYVIYFVSMSAGDSTEIMIPNCVSDYTVSGTNDGGFIVVGRVNG